MSEKPRFFKTPADFRKWLAKNHDKIDVQWVGYYKVATGKPSITWEESVDEALCYGWIDGLRRRIDDEAYKIRFTPRRPRSQWSQKNLDSVKRLIKEGRMESPGLREYENRAPPTGAYSYEKKTGKVADPKLGAEYEKIFKKHKGAWKHFQAQPPGYRRKATHWVISAKKEETRLRRLQRVIDASIEGEAVGPLKRP